MKKSFVFLLGILSWAVWAEAPVSEKYCCFAFKTTGNVLERCQSTMPSPARCDVVFAEMKKEKAAQVSAAVLRERVSQFSFYGTIVAAVAAMVFLLWNRKGRSAKKHEPQKPAARQGQNLPRNNLGGYE